MLAMLTFFDGAFANKLEHFRDIAAASGNGTHHRLFVRRGSCVGETRGQALGEGHNRE